MNAAADEVGNERDAHVVEEICSYVADVPPRSFFLFAGAGSGKTRTLGPAMVRPLLGGLLELGACVRPDGTWDEFAAVAVLRRHDALAKVPSERTARTTRLAELHQAVGRFAGLCRTEGALVKQVLAPVLEANVLPADSRLVEAYRDERLPPPEPARGAGESKEDRQRRGWHALMNAPWAELARYRTYLGGEAPFATHQVVKGSEFKHVMVSWMMRKPKETCSPTTSCSVPS